MDVTERFLKYVRFATASDEASDTVPSTPGQKLFAAYLADELAGLGMRDAHMDDSGYVYAWLPANGSEAAIGFISHMDTAPDASGEGVDPRIVRYEGGDLRLSDKVSITLERFPFLSCFEGQELIVTDGSTLLGADDKAGIAEIVSACEYLIGHPEIKHKQIAVCFTPDEEIGRGTDHFDRSQFRADLAYTVDGGELGEIEYENFNAASCRVRIHGINVHPGAAKNRMKNAVLMMNDYISMLPPAETPAHTEGYEGFYHVTRVSGDETEAELKMIIRDHDHGSFEARKAFVTRLAEYLNGVYGEGSFECEVKDSYYNMKEKILPHMGLIEDAVKAMRDAGVEPIIMPIRGGTDGAMLSYKGLPCPNLSTGGLNFHGVREFIPKAALGRMVEVIVNLSR